MQEYFEIGQIVNTSGLKGVIKVKPFTDDITKFKNFKTIYVSIKKELKELRNGYDEYLLSLYSHYRLKEDNLLNLDNIYALNDSLKQYQTCKADLDKFLLLNLSSATNFDIATGKPN